MMKKVGVLFSLAVLGLAVYLFVTRTYYFYPMFPVSNLSARTVVALFDRSGEDVVRIAELEDYTWYLTESDKDEGYANADKKVVQFIESKGWDYKEKVGSAFIFQNVEEELIVSTQMWTEKYITIQVENKVEDI